MKTYNFTDRPDIADLSHRGRGEGWDLIYTALLSLLKNDIVIFEKEEWVFTTPPNQMWAFLKYAMRNPKPRWTNNLTIKRFRKFLKLNIIGGKCPEGYYFANKPKRQT